MEGQRLGNYRIIKKLGNGAMGEVYLADQLSMARRVAFKILSSHLTSDERFVKRFIREARAAGTMNHPHIVHVYDVGKVNNVYYFSMEYVDGETVKTYLKREGKIPPVRALDIAIQICTALQHAYDHNIVHRDVKPDNIMLTKTGQAKLADLGLAKQITQQSADLTQAGITVGTPHYMAPEQAKAEPVDIRSDIYSLGATLYHTLSGKPPFSGSTPVGILMKHASETPPPLKETVPDLPKELYRAINRMMAKDPRHRFQTPQDALTALKNARDQLTGENRTPIGTKLLRTAAVVAVIVLVFGLLHAASRNKKLRRSHQRSTPPIVKEDREAQITAAMAGIRQALGDPKGAKYQQMKGKYEGLLKEIGDSPQAEAFKDLWTDLEHHIRAQGAFRAAVDFAAANPTRLQHRARLERYQAVVEKYPDTPWAQQAKAQIEKSNKASPPLQGLQRRKEEISKRMKALAEKGEFVRAQHLLDQTRGLLPEDRLHLSQMLEEAKKKQPPNNPKIEPKPPKQQGQAEKEFQETRKNVEKKIQEGNFSNANWMLNRFQKKHPDQFKEEIAHLRDEIKKQQQALQHAKEIEDQFIKKIMWEGIDQAVYELREIIRDVDNSAMQNELRMKLKIFKSYIRMFTRMAEILSSKETPVHDNRLMLKNRSAVHGSLIRIDPKGVTLKDDKTTHYSWQSLHPASIAELALTLLDTSLEDIQAILSFSVMHGASQQAEAAAARFYKGPDVGKERNDACMQKLLQCAKDFEIEDKAAALIEEIIRASQDGDNTSAKIKLKQLDAEYNRTSVYQHNRKQLNDIRKRL